MNFSESTRVNDLTIFIARHFCPSVRPSVCPSRIVSCLRNFWTFS